MGALGRRPTDSYVVVYDRSRRGAGPRALTSSGRRGCGGTCGWRASPPSACSTAAWAAWKGEGTPGHRRVRRRATRRATSPPRAGPALRRRRPRRCEAAIGDPDNGSSINALFAARPSPRAYTLDSHNVPSSATLVDPAYRAGSATPEATRAAFEPRPGALDPPAKRAVHLLRRRDRRHGRRARAGPPGPRRRRRLRRVDERVDGRPRASRRFGGSGLASVVAACTSSASSRASTSTPAAWSRARTSSDLRDAGDPVELAERYDAEGADELVFLDITATHERRDTMVELARRTADKVFIPSRSAAGSARWPTRRPCSTRAPTRSASTRPRSRGPSWSSELAERFGAQCVVLAIDAKRGRRAAGRCSSPAGGRRPAATRSSGPRGSRARGGGDPAHEHGPRRHEGRLRPRADPRGADASACR